MISTILAVWAALSLPVALVAARCIEPPTRKRPEPQPAIDALWVDNQPVEFTLTHTEVELRLRDIEAAEGWATR